MTGSPPITAHLSGIFLVVEYLLVAATGAMLHVGQRPDPRAHLDVDLLVVDLHVAAARSVAHVLGGAAPGGDALPVQPPVLYLDLAPAWPVVSLL